MVIDVDGLRVEVMSEARDGVVTISLDADDPEEAVRRAGVVPLPPYFTGRLEEGGRYQTMFANRPGSSAAPTAGLHFTEAVMQRVRSRGIGVARVDLHVSLDTFRPMTVENVEDHVIHSEWCSIPMETALAIDKARTAGGRIVAVGTTVVRTLESMADSSGGVRAGEGPTDLFLKPGSRFSIVDVLVTNFHMPSSTLLVLLAAFMGEGWRHVYETALLRGYRFLSFGDAMLCVRG
jgi:S-adenosylmethionine:tRNA ribosyltransferase-isomerase